MDSFSTARLALICPEVARKVSQMCDILAQEGLEIRVSCGLRSWTEQEALWFKGRDQDGNVVNKHAIVTNARGGHSWHNFGLAVDLAPDDPTQPGFQIDWNADHPQWKRMEEVGRSVGFIAGADFKRLVDAPHFQLNGRFPIGAPDDECRQMFKDAGMTGVWEEVLKHA